ncbi:uncharacterized protein LOC125726684 [Brienomyrus brachyistius]|uniref:uncharacterized protein LOC125726684 n=1 Tax=Brienomyrus brachyistius TaxID=42636 RepID=UPI0020B36292|nr:uncharacterized protein LOC125726684 [Brienomyrus brachyistius]XP_048859018.1 uncharacterized protein LOC125726684 [Brienomyrus brachyistius]
MTAPPCTAQTTSSNTTVVGLISNNDKSAYRDEVQQLSTWCNENNLSLNVDKTKEMVVDFRRTRPSHTPLSIHGSTVEMVKNTKFLGVHISDDLTWTTNTTSITKKAQQRLHFLRRLKRANLPPPTLTVFYRGTIESVLTSCISVWFGNSTVSDNRRLQRIVKAAGNIIGASLPSLQDIFNNRCIRRASCIVLDSSHPSHGLFTLLSSGRRYRSIRTRSSRLRDSFFPLAIRLLNTLPPPHTPGLRTN